MVEQSWPYGSPYINTFEIENKYIKLNNITRANLRTIHFQQALQNASWNTQNMTRFQFSFPHANYFPIGYRLHDKTHVT